MNDNMMPEYVWIVYLRGGRIDKHICYSKLHLAQTIVSLVDDDSISYSEIIKLF